MLALKLLRALSGPAALNCLNTLSTSTARSCGTGSLQESLQSIARLAQQNAIAATSYSTSSAQPSSQPSPLQAPVPEASTPPSPFLAPTPLAPKEGPATSAPTRNWQWYDYRDEVEWFREQRKPKYPDVGHVKAVNVEQSMRKMTRVLKMIRRLSYTEAMYQLQVCNLKAARIAIKALEKARENAIEKGLDPAKLVIERAWATKGQYTKEINYHGKKKSGIMHHKRSHVQFMLRQVENYTGWNARLVTPFQANVAKRATFSKTKQA